MPDQLQQFEEGHQLQENISVVMTGATGAVGSHAARELVAMEHVERLTLLGRRPLDGISDPKVEQHTIDVLNPETYDQLIGGHTTAICTLGVGQPSKVSREQFLKIDRDAVLDFASTCKRAGVGHFLLLSSVGVDQNSSSFYLRSKGELEAGLRALGFARLSLFHPSMILTPTNRYGIMQGLTLAVWPLLNPLLLGPLRKFRGVKVDQLGRAIARNTARPGPAVETLEWDDFVMLDA